MSTSAESACDAVMGRWVEGVCAKDWDSLRVLYSDDVVLFDVIPPLLFEGRAVEGGFTEWFDWYESALDYRRTQVVTTVDTSLAVTRSLDHIQGWLLSGARTDYWVRHTVVLGRSEAGWTIRHQHASVPVVLPAGDLVDGRVVLATP